jgi:hypothetical protein
MDNSIPSPIDGVPGITFAVICTAEGSYVLATRQTFSTRQSAREYAATVSPSRSPLVVPGRWDMMRPPPMEAVARDNYTPDEEEA